jgi:Iap family predicted aminopeptidase
VIDERLLEIDEAYLRHVVERLESFRSHTLGFRVAGTSEERQATAFIASELRESGLTDVAEEAVPVDGWRLRDAFVELDDGTRYECASFGGVPETGVRGVRGELVRVGRGGRKQLDRLDVAGKVVLVDWVVQRLWPYHVGLELGLRGAVGMIVHAPEGGPYYQASNALGTFDGLWHSEAPPCVTIRREDAAKLNDGAQVRVVLDAPLIPGAEAANVVGVLPGRLDAGPCIVGGHHDGWFGAAFDDASAVAMTLAIARALGGTGAVPERPIIFVSHTAEEYGIANSAYDWCYGAWYQIVAEHPEWSTDARFYLNLEGCGRPGDPFTVDTPPELAAWSRRLCRRAQRDGLLPHGHRFGAPATWTEVWPFLAAGVPGMNVSTFTRQFERTEYHTQYDTAGGVDFDYLARLTLVAARFLLEADAGAADELDYAARARELRGVLSEDALEALSKAHGRERFTAVGRGLHGLDAREAARYPHEQTSADIRWLTAALGHLRTGENSEAAGALARVGLNWLCSDLGREAFATERGRRGRDAPRACWGAQGDPDIGPNLWDELASLRGERSAIEPGAWVERNLEAHLTGAHAELDRRVQRMTAAARGEVLPLPRPRPSELPQGRNAP